MNPLCNQTHINPHFTTKKTSLCMALNIYYGYHTNIVYTLIGQDPNKLYMRDTMTCHLR